jgi:CsoR family transcriptional regulator, copper-sensing transcriptional repressor
MSKINSSLNRIEGQVRGIKRMYEEGRECEQIAQQISAVQSALARVGREIVTEEAVQCIKNRSSRKEIERLLSSLVKIS